MLIIESYLFFVGMIQFIVFYLKLSLNLFFSFGGLL
jgi:hypothetical protein